jgi:hypothetical protein
LAHALEGKADLAQRLTAAATLPKYLLPQLSGGVIQAVLMSAVETAPETSLPVQETNKRKQALN